MKALIVVDMQNDFVSGSLGSAEAQKIVPGVARKIEEYRKAGAPVFFTLDTHEEDYLLTQEGKNLPVKHCLKGTDGWQLSPEVREAAGNAPVCFEKNTFGSEALTRKLVSEKPEEIELVGLCTDICVISNALLIKAFLPETVIRVDASCCAGVTPESHENALKAMKMCQITVING